MGEGRGRRLGGSVFLVISYLKGPTTRWDVDPGVDSQVDMEGHDEKHMGLVGLPLSMFENVSVLIQMVAWLILIYSCSDWM